MAPETQDDQVIVIDGQELDTDDLTFREQRELRSAARDLVGDAGADIDAMALVDFLPALVYVVKKRDDPDYTLEQALELKTKDVLQSRNGKRPTRAAKAAK